MSNADARSGLDQNLANQKRTAGLAGKSMQSGWGRLAAGAWRVGVDRRFGRLGVLLMGLAVSGCVGSGQIANLVDGRRASIAFESLDGPPAAVFQKLMKNLKEEAGVRQIAVVPSSEANYRLRGYLAAHRDGAATSISWALDVYDGDRHRAFRLSGEERTTGHTSAGNWAAADDQLLQRIARAGMTQLAAFVSNPRVAEAAPAPAAPQPRRTASMTGWLDDWTPEASGIFRIFRSGPARAPEIAADAGSPLPPGEVPIPRQRPAPGGEGGGAALAFAAED
jgi:hypothetical protein